LLNDVGEPLAERLRVEDVDPMLSSEIIVAVAVKDSLIFMVRRSIKIKFENGDVGFVFLLIAKEQKI